MHNTIKMCACVACKCPLEQGKTTKVNGQVFCSQACADGHPNQEKCAHATCNC